jgi:cleavage and polyadenylation specificity factor subunit 1
MVVHCFQKSILSRVITRSLLRLRISQKTAIITPFGLFEYLFTPFGLSIAAQTFQRMIDHTTDGLEGVFADMDDSQVGSPDRQTHLRHLEAFFTALATNGLAINLKICFCCTFS